MRKGEQTRLRLVDAATKLFEKQGYAATGIKEILQESSSPRGSFYFHFPGGKEDLAAAVIEGYSATFGEALANVFRQAPTLLIAAELSVEALAQQFMGSGCTSGCPITAIAFEMSNRSERLRVLTQAAFESWIQLISARLILEGSSSKEASLIARVLLSTIEGALILCRSYSSRGPLDDVKSRLKHLLAP